MDALRTSLRAVRSRAATDSFCKGSACKLHALPTTYDKETKS
jgi:hypothetical protein